MFFDEFDLKLNDCFEDVNLFTFEDDNRELEGVAPISNNSRFATVSTQGSQDIITNSNAKSTRKNTNWAMNTFRGTVGLGLQQHFEFPSLYLDILFLKFTIIPMFSFQVLDNTH